MVVVCLLFTCQFNQTDYTSLKEPSWTSLYKGLACLVYLESLGVVHGDHCEIRESLFRHCWPRAGLGLFHLRKRSVSFRACDSVKVQAMTRRRWIFGKAYSSQERSAIVKGDLEVVYVFTTNCYKYFPS